MYKIGPKYIYIYTGYQQCIQVWWPVCFAPFRSTPLFSPLSCASPFHNEDPTNASKKTFSCFLDPQPIVIVVVQCCVVRSNICRDNTSSRLRCNNCRTFVQDLQSYYLRGNNYKAFVACFTRLSFTHISEANLYPHYALSLPAGFMVSGARNSSLILIFQSLFNKIEINIPTQQYKILIKTRTVKARLEEMRFSYINQSTNTDPYRNTLHNKHRV